MVLFQDAKEILDNRSNKQVKVIKDSNDNIIWGSQSAFPYRRVEYVQTPANSEVPVSLEFIPTSATKIDLDFMIIKCNTTAWNPFFGSRGATNTTYLAGFINGTSTKFSPNYAGFDPGNNSTVNISLNVRHSIRNNAGTFYFDNVSYSSISTTNTLRTGTVNFHLFCTGTTSGYYSRNIEMRVYGFKAYEGNTQIRNLVPVVRKSDNEPGFYDTIHGVFYYSNITHISLVAGPLIDEYWDLTAPS